MFKFEEMCELIRLVASTRVAGVEVEHGGTRIRIEGVPQVSVVEASAASGSAVFAPASVSYPIVEGEQLPVDAGADGEELHYVTSPIVGTFYRAPNPDADPYARVGDLVSEGQTLCIIEATKLMNECVKFRLTISEFSPSKGFDAQTKEEIAAVTGMKKQAVGGTKKLYDPGCDPIKNARSVRGCNNNYPLA